MAPNEGRFKFLVTHRPQEHGFPFKAEFSASRSIIRFRIRLRLIYSADVLSRVWHKGEKIETQICSEAKDFWRRSNKPFTSKFKLSIERYDLRANYIACYFENTPVHYYIGIPIQFDSNLVSFYFTRVKERGRAI